MSDERILFLNHPSIKRLMLIYTYVIIFSGVIGLFQIDKNRISVGIFYLFGIVFCLCEIVCGIILYKSIKSLDLNIKYINFKILFCSITPIIIYFLSLEKINEEIIVRLSLLLGFIVLAISLKRVITTNQIKILQLLIIILLVTYLLITLISLSIIIIEKRNFISLMIDYDITVLFSGVALFVVDLFLSVFIGFVLPYRIIKSLRNHQP